MASDRSSPRHNSSRHSIRLQDLSRPPDSNLSDRSDFGHRRSTASRTRSLLDTRHSISGGLNVAYERVDEGSPPAHDRQRLDIPHVTTPRSAHRSYQWEDGEVSPVNGKEFQAAMGSVGLSFDSVNHSASAERASPSIAPSNLGVISETEDSISPFTHLPLDGQGESYFPQTDDSTPLTDARYLQPISGAQRHDRKNSAWSFQEGSSQGSRLGDDLPHSEGGVRRSSSSAAFNRLSTHLARSSSVAASPLSRAGSMMRKMSQRVVNLSNEPEVIEQTIRRQSSAKGARLNEPPSFPAMAEYAHDEPLPTVGLSPSEQAKEDSRARNPLRGNSLFIFSPNSWIRLKLCEMLVHPVTEPVILVLIVIQTILLAIDSAKKVEQGQRSGEKWGKTHYAMLVLFSIYTVELLARIVVSGFIKNAKDYSTLDLSHGFKSAVHAKAQSLFTPERPASALNTANPANAAEFQPSILRSFTTMQAQAGQSGSSRQQQRNRLARRAFMRHSFNRLDFLAVVSYWISFALSLTHYETIHHLYVFRMLSCLRILRLLSLTSGTSVSHPSDSHSIIISRC